MRGTILVGCGVAIALTLSGCFAADPTSSTQTPEPTVTVTVTATPTPDPEPSEQPTEEPTETPTPDPTATASPGSKNVPVRVTLAEYESDLQQLHVAVTMTGIAEEGGVCTATATKGSKSATVTQTADYNVNRVECGGLRFDRSDLSAGNWKVKVAYKSKAYTGLSSSSTVKVP